uniref:Uncharacterized protein n=1 Tax=Glossina palpalis gambiensis TaxID=67801 RepID=A0A1B0BZQ2_9MUSC
MIAVGAYVRQCIWKPTVRRGRAICEFGRPSYKPLPPIVGAKVFDSTKRTAPAYSFGRKTGSRRTGFDDGPAKFDVSGMSNRGFYKKVGIAMKSRRVELKPFPNPGVGNYVVDRGFAVTTKTIPRYSFGKKPQQLKPFMTPAPNVYNLPPVVGTAKEGNKKAAPAFTMLGREKPRKLTCFIYPGPGDYEDKSVCKRKCPPKYTMRPQTKVLDDSINKPSPNAHYAELNGYKVKLLKAENCAGDDAVIKIGENFNIKLNKKCELIPKGCVTYKAFNSALARYKVKKDGVLVKDDMTDLCSKVLEATAEYKKMLNVYGAPNKCPVEEETICNEDKKLNLSKYKSLLNIARGRVSINSTVEHDTGKSCLHLDMEFTKK